MSKTKKTKLDQLLQHVPEETKRLVQIQDEIAIQINAVLKAKGWKHKEFAQMIGMKESQLSKILAGNANLTLKTIARIESVLKVEIIHFFFGTEKEKSITMHLSINSDQYFHENYSKLHFNLINTHIHNKMFLSNSEYNKVKYNA